jgi:hypothetical protein
MSLLENSIHKILPNTSLYIFHKSFPYPPFYDYKINDSVKTFGIDKIEIKTHNLTKYRPHTWTGGSNSYMTILTFISTGNYNFNITEFNTDKNIEHKINVQCVDKYEEYAKELEKEGHTCVQILESIPPQVIYCNNDPCKNRKK